jgi:DNA invertase Pin-like site-specific DNA recombinase
MGFDRDYLGLGPIVPTRYDDGGFSGGNMDRPALNSLIEDIKARKIDCVVVYKVDRLSRSLLDFSRLISLFDEYQVSFVSVTQQFNTTTSMGRLTLNILLSFAQFEREIIGERIRDKKLLTARQGKYIGGQPKLGFDIVDRRYAVNETEAKLVKRIFKLATQQQSCLKIAETLNAEGLRSKVFTTKTGKTMGGKHYTGRLIHNILTDAKYIGKIVHKGQAYDAEHPAILTKTLSYYRCAKTDPGDCSVCLDRHHRKVLTRPGVGKRQHDLQVVKCAFRMEVTFFDPKPMSLVRHRYECARWLHATAQNLERLNFAARRFFKR